jgi:phosphotransferase system IIB component
MSCDECATRLRHVEESEALVADQRLRYLHHDGPVATRRMGSVVHQLRQALENLEFHQRECGK